MMTLIKLIISLFLIVLPPIIGISFVGRDIWQYLEFPPNIIFIRHAPFSLPIFLIASFIDMLLFLPLLIVITNAVLHSDGMKRDAQGKFPWWGYVGMVCGICSWILAWTRFSWFSGFQPYTFTPLWLSYIVVVNAIAEWRYGECSIKDAPFRFFLLFPISALFWWLFEYLNRFVQNWHYLNATQNPWEYFLHASISFSTVLPAVLSTRDLLLKSPLIKRACNYLPAFKIRIQRPCLVAFFCILISCTCLFLIGIFPDYLFFLIWICPLLIVIGIQGISGQRHIFSGTLKGEWEIVISSALSALICGFFWEMWNFYSFTKWEYMIPFVDRFHIFEMPILGYAGYIPFGLLCIALIQMLKMDHV